MLTTKPRGTNDFLPGEVEKWQALEGTIRDICRTFGYKEIRTPIFEHTELFLRSVGETSDIVEKEMYSFEDKAFRHLTLRPENTAGVVRAFLENKLYANPQPTKLYYIGPMFRYDQPQAGRYRQFNQFGVEVMGSNDPSVDAEVITLANRLFQALGLDKLTVKINTVGCPNCRPAHSQKLKEYFAQYKEDLCPTCQSRLERNPLRILDCKEEKCKAVAKNAPTTIEDACDDCKGHFEKVMEYLTIAGIHYEVDTNLVRGLDYYTQTAFEVVVNTIGSAQNAVCGGGRYNSLLEQCGGEDMPGIGFAIGMERLLLTLKEQGIELTEPVIPGVYVAPLGQKAQGKAFELTLALRDKGIYAEKDYLNRSLKAQMKSADRMNAQYVVIIGDDELEKGVAVVRTMADSSQEEVLLNEIVAYIEGRLR